MNMQTQTRGEQGETDEWLEIQHLRALLRETQARLEARESELELARREIARLRVSHLSGGTP